MDVLSRHAGRMSALLWMCVLGCDAGLTELHSCGELAESACGRVARCGGAESDADCREAVYDHCLSAETADVYAPSVCAQALDEGCGVAPARACDGLEERLACDRCPAEPPASGLVAVCCELAPTSAVCGQCVNPIEVEAAPPSAGAPGSRP
jgi:hypothetical protein